MSTIRLRTGSVRLDLLGRRHRTAGRKKGDRLADRSPSCCPKLHFSVHLFWCRTVPVACLKSGFATGTCSTPDDVGGSRNILLVTDWIDSVRGGCPGRSANKDNQTQEGKRRRKPVGVPKVGAATESTAEYTSNATPGMRLPYSKPNQKRRCAQCESNGKMVQVDVCAGVRSAAASITKLTKTGRENRTREAKNQSPKHLFHFSPGAPIGLFSLCPMNWDTPTH